MKRYFGTFRRHFIALSLPLVLAVGSAGFYAAHVKAQYTSTATVESDNPLPDTSTLEQPTNGITPAGQESAVLEGYLHIHSFLVGVVARTPIARYVSKLPSAQAEAVLAQLATSVSLSTPGPQVLNITAKADSPALAAGLAGAVAHQFSQQVTGTLLSRARQSLAYSKQQETTTQSVLQDARHTLALYVGVHPNASLANPDPTYSSLSASLASAQQAYDSATNNYLNASLEVADSANSTVAKVVDEPTAPTKLSSKKRVIFTGVGAVLGGAVITILILTWMVSSDRSVRYADDLEAALSLRVIGDVAHLSDRRAKEPHL